jgi:beta-lactamase regulating signal transducer with metallopeptidase domain
MNALMIGSPATALVVLVAKATVLISLAALAVLLGRRLSAATRHWTITLVIGGLLGLPFLSGVLPSWTVVEVPATVGRAKALPAQADPSPAGALHLDGSAGWAFDRQGKARDSDSGRDGNSDRAGGASWSAAASGAEAEALLNNFRASPWTFAAVLYLAGAVLLLLRLMRQVVAARRLVRRGERMLDHGWQALLDEGRVLLGIERPINLLRGDAKTMPMALGVWRAAVLLPSIAEEWTTERRRAVLLHELSHVARYDCLTQLLAGVACAVYWPHPGVWWLSRRLRVERELACDDLVLDAGTPATDYAGHLLDVAYTLGGERTGALAVGMARRSQLEGRMLAVLDAARNRAVPGPRVRTFVAALAVVALVPIAVATVTTEPLLTVNHDFEPPHAATTAAVGTTTSDARPATIKAELRRAPWAGMVEAAREQAAALVPRGSGSWSLAPSKTAGEVYLEMREGQSRNGTNVKLAGLEGLTESQLSSGGPVKFAIRRDAGIFTFEGTVRDGHGGGTFSFAASQTFPSELEKRGVGRPTASEQYEMARHDVGLGLVDELTKRGYTRPTVAELVKAGHHGVRVDYVREMADLGYAVGTLPALITLRDHGVTPGFARGLASQGFSKIPVDELRRVRDHGVTPEFIGELKGLGFTLSLAEYVKVRDHGVTPQYVSEMRALGYSGLPIDAVVNARNHGVTPDFVKGLAEQGYAKLSLDEVVKTRDHGVNPDFVREMRALGHQGPLAELVRARDHGVTPDYARGLKGLGYDNLSLAELITLRDHGVTPEKVKRANEKAGTKLPADMLRSLASNGWR